jgi:hypothetical protein
MTETLQAERKRTRARRAAGERLVWAAAVAVPMFVAAGLLRPAERIGVYPKKYWADKLAWRRCADLVAAGDSRVYMGISPAVIERHLPGARVVNFGFSAVGYSPDYLAAVERVLDGSAAERIILLGVTPHSLTPNACRRSGFTDTRERATRQDATCLELEARFGRFFERVPLDDTVDRMLGVRTAGQYLTRYHADGWMEILRAHRDPELAIRLWEGDPKVHDNPVDPNVVQRLVAAVRRWTAAGIRVYGFRPPISAAMCRIEQTLAPFDEAAFVRRFQAAGGRWIDVAPERYPTYDGHHLHRDVAVRLSGDLAAHILATLPAPGAADRFAARPQ